MLIFEDVTARVRADRKILHMARYDALTGLPQRGYFGELVRERLEQEDAFGASVGFMILDVVDFKHVNDLRGHLTGDRLLTAIANRLTALVAGRAIVGHLVGDQFVLFFPNVDNRTDLEAEMRTVHGAASGYCDIEGLRLPVSFSAGAAIFDSATLSMEDWPVKVDIALFESKARSGGQFTLFVGEMDARYLERQRLKEDLRAAVDNGDVTVVYQPMFSPDGRRSVAVRHWRAGTIRKREQSPPISSSRSPRRWASFLRSPPRCCGEPVPIVAPGPPASGFR